MNNLMLEAFGATIEISRATHCSIIKQDCPGIVFSLFTAAGESCKRTNFMLNLCTDQIPLDDPDLRICWLAEVSGCLVENSTEFYCEYSSKFMVVAVLSGSSYAVSY